MRQSAWHFVLGDEFGGFDFFDEPVDELGKEWAQKAQNNARDDENEREADLHPEVVLVDAHHRSAHRIDNVSCREEWRDPLKE